MRPLRLALAALLLALSVQAEDVDNSANDDDYELPTDDFYQYVDEDFYDNDTYQKNHALLVTFVIMMVILRVSTKEDIKQNVELTVLQQQVLRAVYSQPGIKSEVQKLVGQDELGNVPPVLGLGIFGAQAEEQRKLTKRQLCLRLVPYFVGVGVLAICVALPNVSLWAYIGICVAVVVLQCGAIYFGRLWKPTKRYCQCCVCGKVASNDEGAERLQHTEQDCPNCHGTGVCSPSCERCANDSTKRASPWRKEDKNSLKTPMVTAEGHTMS